MECYNLHFSIFGIRESMISVSIEIFVMAFHKLLINRKQIYILFVISVCKTLIFLF
jgi:hypothetical protein